MKKFLRHGSKAVPVGGRSVGKRILLGLGVAAGAVALALVCWLAVQLVKAPDITEMDAIPHGYRTTVLDGAGETADVLYVSESNRVYVELEQIPQDLQNAFVAIEDARFYRHGGIDPRGIGRAFVRGVQNGLDFHEGASTITQQLLKNNVFSDWMTEQTFRDRLSRKVQEMYLAVRLDGKCSKEWILENYLNTINLGGGTRGVQVAAQYYFGKDVSELTLPECALIAGITKSPNAYNPIRHGDKSVERQGLVLDAMRNEGYITDEEYEAAKQENVLSHLVREHEGLGQFDWFEDALLLSIVSDLQEQYGASEEEAWDLIYGGGLTIYSTEDMRLQEICEAAARNSAYRQAGEEVSIVMTDVATGAVTAIVGGREEKAGSLVYDRATDSQRQPGSTIKVIGEYAAALDQGLVTLGTVVDDEPYTYSDGTALHNADGSFGGMTTVKEAISQSCNVAALKVYQQAGADTTEDYLRRFGISTLDGQDYANEALAIGGTYHGVTNVELTAAYNAIAGGGVYRKPHFYTRVVDHNGAVLLEQPVSGTRVVKEETAALLTLAMEDVMENGTGRTAKPSNVRTAGKSGTTNDKRDLWFVGFSEEMTCGVWGGFDDNSTQSGGDYVKRLWRSVMESAHTGSSGMGELADTSGLTRVEICTKCGKLAVRGLCDDTMQGDMTEMEYFVSGTEPTEECDCHVRLSVCQDSGKIANTFCPIGSRETGVYLTSGTAGTEDEAVSAESILGTSCDVHEHVGDFFSGFFDREDESEAESQWDGSGYDDGAGYDDDGYGYDEGYGYDWGSVGDWFHDWGNEFSEFWNNW